MEAMKEIKTTERDRIIKALQAHYKTLQERYNIKAIGLFGSIARQRQSSESDADIYVEFERKSFKNVAGALQYLQQLIGRKIDLIYPHKSANKAIIEAIKKEVLWITPPKSY